MDRVRKAQEEKEQRECKKKEKAEERKRKREEKEKRAKEKTQKEGLVNLDIREPTNHLLLVNLKVVIVPYVMPHIMKMMNCGYNVRIVKCGVTKTVLVMEIGRKKT